MTNRGFYKRHYLKYLLESNKDLRDIHDLVKYSRLLIHGGPTIERHVLHSNINLCRLNNKQEILKL